MDYRIYRVRAHDREPLLAFILDALKTAGCRIIRSTPPTEAPFRISFETPSGERLGILCYAFLATFTPTKNRPPDEHSFQIKYGSKDAVAKPQKLYQDEYGIYTTLFCGINPDLGIFVGADPEMHNPTKFFIRLEFKQAHVDEIVKRSWYAWERKKAGPTTAVDPVEVLVGGTSKSFLQYVRFERAAFRLDQGHRQLLAEKMDLVPTTVKPTADLVVASPATVHQLAKEFEMSESAVLDLIASARRLKMAVRGWVAEKHLVRTLQGIEGVTDCRQSDEEGGPDVLVRFRGSRELTIQCKNVLRERAADGRARMDFQKTRTSKNDPCSRFYRIDEYDLIAACLHAVTERWEFQYAVPRSLDPHKSCVGRLANNVRIDHRWVPDAEAALLRAAHLNT